MPFNNTAKDEALKSGTGGGVSGAISHIGVFAASAEPGTGTNSTGTEAVGGSPPYARQTVTWGSVAGTGLLTNSNALTFDVPAGTYGYLSYHNASTGNTGNYRGYGPLNGTVKGFGTVDTADVTANAITSNGHGLVNTDRVTVYNVFAESIPTGLTEGTLYFVVGAATDTFQVSLTSGGAAIDITAVGELFWQKAIPEVFASQGQITVAAGQITLDATAM
jgi:hypothetical protein